MNNCISGSLNIKKFYVEMLIGASTEVKGDQFACQIIEKIGVDEIASRLVREMIFEISFDENSIAVFRLTSRPDDDILSLRLTVIDGGNLDDIKELIRFSEEDELTGVYNRKVFAREARVRIRKRRGFVVMFDVDKLKQINSRLGHDAGDQAIKATAIALKQVFRRSADIICRVGGDEFMILVDAIESDLVKYLELVSSSLLKVGVSVTWAYRTLGSGSIVGTICDTDEAIKEVTHRLSLEVTSKKSNKCLVG